MPEPEIERKKRKKEGKGRRMTLYGSVEEDNNIVNQMWLYPPQQTLTSALTGKH